MLFVSKFIKLLHSTRLYVNMTIVDTPFKCQLVKGEKIMRNKQNISVYVRKETYDKLAYLSEVMQEPISRFIRVSLESEDFNKVLDTLVSLAKEIDFTKYKGVDILKDLDKDND